MKVRYSLFILAALISTYPNSQYVYATDNQESINAPVEELTMEQKEDILKKVKNTFEKYNITKDRFGHEETIMTLLENKFIMYGGLDNLSFNEKKEVLSDIFTLNWITHLNISLNDELGPLPETISNLKNLKTLNLRYNNLTSFPETINSLTNLQELDLANNRLTTVPASIKNISSLNVINLRDNPHLLTRSDNPLELGKKELRAHFGDRVILDD